MTIISPSMFCTLLSNLVSKFFLEDRALCAISEDYGGQLVKDTQEFFSIVVQYADLHNLVDVMGVLSDDSKNTKKNSYTLVVYFDSNKFHGGAHNINIAVVLAHEICHFVFFYELFLEKGGVFCTDVYNKFKNSISGKLEDSFFNYKFDMHNLFNIRDLPNVIRLFEDFTTEHFSKNIIDSKIDYRSFFRHFLKHLRIS